MATYYVRMVRQFKCVLEIDAESEDEARRLAIQTDPGDPREIQADERENCRDAYYVRQVDERVWEDDQR